MTGDFWTINANVQIATGVVLIVALLTYMALFKKPKASH